MIKELFCPIGTRTIQVIISPKTNDPDAFDPIEELIKVVKADPTYALIAGYGRDGKKVKDAHKNPEVRLGSMWSGYVANAMSVSAH